MALENKDLPQDYYLELERMLPAMLIQSLQSQFRLMPAEASGVFQELLAIIRQSISLSEIRELVGAKYKEFLKAIGKKCASFSVFLDEAQDKFTEEYFTMGKVMAARAILMGEISIYQIATDYVEEVKNMVIALLDTKGKKPVYGQDGSVNLVVVHVKYLIDKVGRRRFFEILEKPDSQWGLSGVIANAIKAHRNRLNMVVIEDQLQIAARVMVPQDKKSHLTIVSPPTPHKPWCSPSSPDEK